MLGCYDEKKKKDFVNFKKIALGLRKKTQISFHALMCWNILTGLKIQNVFYMGNNEQQELGVYDVEDGKITILENSSQASRELDDHLYSTRTSCSL